MSISATKKGFSLVEAIVAVSILLVGLIAVGEFFPLGIKIIGDAQRESTAANLAIAEIEEIQAIDYDSITPATFESKHRLSDDPENYLYGYQRETLVNYVNNDLNPSAGDIGLKKVTVSVYWQSLIGKNEKSISITALKTKF